MKDDKVFIDTNIIVYAYDISDKEKHYKAVEIIEGLWKSGLGVVSTQVLQEFFFNVTKKIPNPLDVIATREIIKDFLKWDVVVNNGDSVIEAIEIHQKYKYSFWDSLIITSAMRGRANLLLSEDFSDGQIIEGVAIRNPFK
ncbi:MAG: PIN domain-containing protein [Nitrospirae bacterium]|nr:PIN domain-containing protein [Nitrospirota bacterium]